MIKKVTDPNDIIEVWQEAFGDSKEEILFFVNNVKNADCIGYYIEGKIASLMYLVECKAEGIKSNYIYAACTLNKYRGRGYMTKIIEYAKEKYDSVCLIPASDSLVDYYSDRGLDIKISINSIQFNQEAEIEEYLFEGYKLSEPCALFFRGEKDDI